MVSNKTRDTVSSNNQEKIQNPDSIRFRKNNPNTWHGPKKIRQEILFQTHNQHPAVRLLLYTGA